MLRISIFIAAMTIGISISLCLYRILKGPSVLDRILAQDTMAVHIVALLMILSIQLASKIYLQAALLVALFGFLSTAAMAKFLLKGKIIDGPSD